MDSGIQENIALHSWTRKHESLTSKQKKPLLSEIWIQSRKMKNKQLETWEARHRVVKVALWRDQGGRNGLGEGQVPEILSCSGPRPKALTSPDINAEKQTIGRGELWLEIWSQGYVSTVKELKWGKDMEHKIWWMFGCVNSMGGLGVWGLELWGWKQPTEEKSLDPGSKFTQLHINHQETTCFQRQNSSHKEGNAERQYGSGKIFQATGSGDWNAVFPQLTTQGTQQMPWFRGTFGFCLTSTHWRGLWGGPGDRETKEKVRKGKARKLSISFLRSFQRPWTGGDKRSSWMRPSTTQNPVLLFYSSGT